MSKKVIEITNLIFELEASLFDKQGKLAEGGKELLLWMRFREYGAGFVSELPSKDVVSILKASGVGDYFDQGICKEELNLDDKNPYYTAREELSEVGFLNKGANEDEAFALAEAIEAYAIVGTEKGLRLAHDAGCHTALILEESKSDTIPIEAQILADEIFTSLEEFRKELEGASSKPEIKLDILPYDLSVCKVKDQTEFDHNTEFYFVARTRDEFSLVYKTEEVQKLDPEKVIAREDGWKAFKIKGQLDFSLVGILSQITGLLAKFRIGIFAVSTVDTDYILVKEEQFENAKTILTKFGYID